MVGREGALFTAVLAERAGSVARVLLPGVQPSRRAIKGLDRVLHVSRRVAPSSQLTSLSSSSYRGDSARRDSQA